MNKLLIIFALLLSTVHVFIIDEPFDINDVENRACQNNCIAENFRQTSAKITYDRLLHCTDCTRLFKLCVEYRTCKDSCVPAFPVLPYEQAKEFALRVRPSINPCLDFVTACNYESMDSYEILRTENPFLFG
ncbi:unnamed protein product [Caenorhabditis brenneri]